MFIDFHQLSTMFREFLKLDEDTTRKIDADQADEFFLSLGCVPDIHGRLRPCGE